MLSKRERYIVIATALVLAVLAADWYVLTPLLAERDAMAAKHEKLQRDFDVNQRLLTSRRALGAKWKQIRAGGLQLTASEAESQLLNSLRKWSSDAGITLGSVKPERQAKLQDMQELTFQAVGSGTMQSIATFLHRIETTPLPVRIRELQLSSRNEGTDDLTVQLRISTLYQPEEKPAADATPAITASTPEPR